MKKFAEKPPMIIISGSCLNFDKERKKIVEIIEGLQIFVSSQTRCEVSSNGTALGWEFFQIYFDPLFVEKLVLHFPDISKEEGTTLEQQFVLWLIKQFKKRKLNYYFKLNDIPYENTKGFRLNPENYRDDSLLEDLR
ncbi:MAG TPA: hypothetical protein VFM31_03900 [Nitrososphaeraceae archaeon]|nr:hypothetical protein [Nitrososphaeraceae archaeon]